MLRPLRFNNLPPSWLPLVPLNAHKATRVSAVIEVYRVSAATNRNSMMALALDLVPPPPPLLALACSLRLRRNGNHPRVNLRLEELLHL